MSTQYLVQPFVWANWTVSEVLLGWVEVATSRLILALSVAAATLIAIRVNATRAATRAFYVATAVLTGACAGEIILVATGFPGARGDTAAIVGGTVQWFVLALCVAATYWLWMRDREFRARTRANDEARANNQKLQLQAELQVLRQQIDPHFLFNTLATIRRLKETETDLGLRLLRHLVEYLNVAKAAPRDDTTIGEELDLVTSYLSIVQMRFGERLSVVYDVESSLLSHRCPPLALATLVENAVKHGVGPSSESAVIAVRVRRSADSVEIVVEDTGVGVSSAAMLIGGGGIGLANVSARLHAIYGSRASLQLTANAPRGLRATITIPVDAGYNV